MTDEELRGWMQTALRFRGVEVDPHDLPVAQLRAVLQRLEALDVVDAWGEEELALPWERP
ncbi:MAG: hypothetical protein C4303_07165 [candidate division GAL15 bacterium]